MSGFEMKPVDEAQLNAFLDGKDELSKLLQALPQPSPTAELDAAILRMVSEDLARQDGAGNEIAANDAVFGKDKRVDQTAIGSGFWQKWRLPFALAASAAFAIPVYFLNFSQSNQDVADIAATESAATSAKIAMADTSMAAVATSQSAPLNKEKVATSPTPTGLASAQLNVQKNIVAKKNLPARHESAQAIATPAVEKEQAAAGQVLADASQAIRNGAQERDEASRVASDQYARERARMVQEGRQIADAKRQAEVASQLKVAKDSERIDTDKAKGAVVARAPVAAAPPAVTVQAETLPSSAKSDLAEATSNKKLAANEHQARAKAWLALVEELLKAGMQQEALDEWQKFRKAYPYEFVSERLQLQMKALQKDQLDQKK